MRVYMLILLFSLGLVACSMMTPEPVVKDETTISDKLTPQEKQQLLELINNVRVAGCTCGRSYMPPAPALALHSQLSSAAGIHARDMERNNHFAHQGTDGSQVGERLNRTGYNWSAVGENIAWGYERVEHVFRGWLDSPGHCKNMMDANFEHLGVAREATYWVTTFGRAR